LAGPKAPATTRWPDEETIIGCLKKKRGKKKQSRGGLKGRKGRSGKAGLTRKFRPPENQKCPTKGLTQTREAPWDHKGEPKGGGIPKRGEPDGKTRN